MQPIAVFIAGEGLDAAWTVAGWDAAWDAIDGAYQELGEASVPLAWCVSMTEGSGPVTALHLMDPVMWSAVAPDWRALRDYLHCGDLTPDFLHPARRIKRGKGRSPLVAGPAGAAEAEAGVPGRATLETPSGSDL